MSENRDPNLLEKMNTGPATMTNHSAAPETNMPTTTITSGSNLPSDEAEWNIEAVTADEEGCRFYLEHYKPFRLEALQQDPDGRLLALVSFLLHLFSAAEKSQHTEL